MTYKPHALIALSGDWIGSDMAGEVWAMNIRAESDHSGRSTLVDAQSYITAVGPNIATWFGGSIGARADCRLKLIKCNNIDADGHYIDPITHQYVLPTPIVGSATATGMPSFVTLVATWETGRTSGVARRGRSYLPVSTTWQTGTINQVTAARMTAIRDAYRALFNIIHVSGPSEGSDLLCPIVASKKGAVSARITGVSVDSVVDVQRRRKNRSTSTRTAIAPCP